MSAIDPTLHPSTPLKSKFDAERTTLDEDALTFVAETAPQQEKAFWKVMIVDDDPSVHQTTEVALRHLTFENRSLKFISAYSAEETLKLLPLHPDIAFILLDVVMETPNAGLKVAQYIRETQGNRAVRIILRTGQPGQVPEESVVLHYDINDYKTKLELTHNKLFTTVIASLRAYRDLIALEENRQELAQANSKLSTFNKDLETLVSQRTEELLREIDERQKAEDALKIYVNALTHDLRNPVISLLQILQSLIRHDPLDSIAPSSIQVTLTILKGMEDGCHRLLKMIEHLLCAEEYSNQAVKIQCQPLNLSELINSLLYEWHFKLKQKRITIECHIPDNLPNILGDYDQLCRVFENLISNSVKYNQFGLKIEIKADISAENPSMVHVTVADNGIGMSPSQCESIFNLYQRGCNAGKNIRGLGIGLFICRQIIKAHGGEIGVISQLHEGAQFWLTLPIQSEVSMKVV